MALVESLLTAIVRADGDALVMHVGEKPYVVASAGPIELSTHGLNLQAMAGMVAQLLPQELQRALTEFGAVEHELPPREAANGDRFTVVVARGGEDIWIEIRRHRRSPAAATAAPEGTASAPMAPVTETPQAVADNPVTTETTASSDATASSHPTAVSIDAANPGIGHDVTSAASDPPADVAQISAAPSEDVPDPALDVDTLVAEHDALAGGSALPVAEEAPAVAAVADAGATSTPDFVSAPAGNMSEQVLDQISPQPEVEPTFSEVHTLQPDGSPRPEAASEVGGPPTAAVLPMTPKVRLDVPPPPALRDMSGPSEIRRLLALAVARGATGLYLTTHAVPFLRIDDDMRAADGELPLSATAVEAAVLDFVPAAHGDAVRRGEPTEWTTELPDIGRVRCSTFRDHRGPGAIFQLISLRPLSADALGLTAAMQALASESEGLVLVATPPGQGKTTLVAALVDLVNRRRPGYIITLERHIRVVHEHRAALVSQREMSGTPEQALALARAALRENPDVLVIEDLSSVEMMELALEAAGAGLLVVASLTASSTTAALQRITEMFPAEQRAAIHARLAEHVRGAIAQVLLRPAGGRRVPARELLLPTAAVADVLAEGRLAELPTAIERGRAHGLTTLTEMLVRLVRGGVIDVREAHRKTGDRGALLQALKRENVDTSFVERSA